MADNLSRCRGIGALAALWDQARQTGGGSPAGLRVLVDLDEGTVFAAPWNEAGFETTGESWQGQGVLDGLLQAAAPLFDADAASIPAFLLDGNAMALCSRRISAAKTIAQMATTTEITATIVVRFPQEAVCEQSLAKHCADVAATPIVVKVKTLILLLIMFKFLVF